MGESGPPINRMFLRMSVIECSLHFTSLDIRDVVNISLQIACQVYNHLTLLGIQVLRVLTNGLGVKGCLSRGNTIVLGRHYPA